MTPKTPDKTKNKKTLQKTQNTPEPSVLDRVRSLWKEIQNSGDETENPDNMSRGEIIRFAIGSIIFIVSCFLILSIVSHIFTGAQDCSYVENVPGLRPANWMGKWGLSTARFFIDECWGLASIFVPIFGLVTSLRIMHVYKVRLWKWFLNCGVLMIWISAFGAYFLRGVFETFHSHISAGGAIGLQEVEIMQDRAGSVGTFFILLITAVAYLAYLSDETIRIIRKILYPKELIDKLKHKDENEDEANSEETIPAPVVAEENEESEEPTPEEVPTVIDLDIVDNTDSEDDKTEIGFTIEKGTDDEQPASNPPAEPEMEITFGTEEKEADLDETLALEPYDPKLDLEFYHYPTVDLLKHYDISNNVDMEEQQENKTKIIQVLQNFGVNISSIKATVGPTITLYEITPAPGVRISKIRGLEDDIALSLSALGIRIIAPIPGKGTIGIEVPNARPQIVSMESIINSKKFQESTMELPMALGKTITNEIFMADLAKMPHLLVAGATGQGKSVGLNAIITSLLYKKHPAELKLVMVDPKQVEFSIYSPLVNHFLTKVEGCEDDEPIITDVQKVITTLKSLCVEMDSRYQLLKRASVRNIKEYNEKFKARRLNPENGHRFMPYIVVIIDEFGDLIMTAGKEIELPICRIAQLARAVGMHMIIATQRPTTNIITGTIKANFPARMAFKVGAMVDSRTILDRPGANQLVGKGDMLFLSGTEPIRVQCAFVDTPEVDSINKYVACQQSYSGPTLLPPVPMDGDDAEAPDVDLQHLDPMFEEVARMVVQTQQGSTSMIQRKFSIGYNRAGRLMDQLEVAGIVGPAHGSKPREVLCISEEDLQFRLDNLR